uniref:Cilia- and flagella-associated protein 57 n=1 Tax=Lotharella globosa TaxID=91324 RepID=A0A7S4DG22_9EUKA
MDSKLLKRGSHLRSPAVGLKLDYLFGLGPKVTNNVEYVEETEVLFPCGHYVISYDTEKRTQNFMTNPQASVGQKITAMAVNQKCKLLAVAESGDGDNPPWITIYDVETHKAKRLPFSPDQKSREIVCMDLSPDGHTLLTLGGAPDYQLTNWQWQKGRALQKQKISNPTSAKIYQCSYCPTDPACVCLTGDGILHFMRIEISEFRVIRYSLGNREPQNYLCHAWVDVRLLIGTEKGDILVFINAEYRGILESSPGNPIYCIATYSKGFVCGCDRALLYVFEPDERAMYKRNKSFEIDGNFKKITSISVSPAEDTIACALENSQAYVMGISNTDIAEDMSFEPLALPFHHQAITGLDSCLRKPLVVTCGLDKSVRVWNYLEKTLESIRFFNEEPYSVAIHPSGFHILVGFIDSLKLLNLLMDDVKLCKEFPIRGCHECHFSNGGHLFAAVDGPQIVIYRTYTCEEVGRLKQHTGKVTSIQWAEDDSILFSAGVDGSVFQWSVSSLISVAEHKQKGCNYTCVLGRSVIKGLKSGERARSNEMFVIGSDMMIKQINQSGVLSEKAVSMAVSQMVMNTEKRLIVAGTSKGSLLSCGLSDGKLVENEIPPINCHDGKCTRMRLSADQKYLFTASEDGTLAMFEIVDSAEKHSKKGKEKKDDGRLPWSEDILVSKRNLEAKLTMLTTLKAKVEELQHRNQIQLAEKQKSYRAKMDEVEQKFNAELALDQKRYGELEGTKIKLEQEFEARMHKLQEQKESRIKSLVEHHQQKLQTETEKFDELMESRASAEADWKNQYQSTIEKYVAEKRALDKENARQLREKHREQEEAEHQKKAVKRDFKETQELMEEITDREFEDLKSKYDKILNTEQKETLQLKDENASLRRKFEKLQEQINENDAELKSKTDEREKKRLGIENLKKDIKSQEKEIRDRQATIQEKDNLIRDLRKKNQELEKFKFVLDYKISELQKQNNPREAESRECAKQLHEMKRELGLYETKNSILKLGREDCQQKLEGISKSIEKHSGDMAEVIMVIKKIKLELKDLKKIKTYKEQAKFVKALHARYSSREANHPRAKKSLTQEHDANKEHLRNRSFLERTVESLKRQLRKDVKHAQRDYDRIMKENVVLVREINNLRRQYQTTVESMKLKDQRIEKKRRERMRRNAQRDAQRSGKLTGLEPIHQSPPSHRSIGDSKQQIAAQQEQIAHLKQQLQELLEREQQQMKVRKIL